MPFGLRTRVGPGNHILDGGPYPSSEGAILSKRRAHCKYRDFLLWAVQERFEPINLPFGLWTRVGRRKHKFNRVHLVASMCLQCHWTVCLLWWCGLTSNYFDHLLLLFRHSGIQCCSLGDWKAVWPITTAPQIQKVTDEIPGSQIPKNNAGYSSRDNILLISSPHNKYKYKIPLNPN